jgi:hypothetical protein
MSSTRGHVGCLPTQDLGEVLGLASEVGTLPTEGAESYDERTYGVLSSAGRSR